eukprot:5623953-Ditylum_brightwellii.AAC.1
MRSSRLDCTGVFPDDVLLDIYMIYKEASDLKFKMWAINEHQKCKEQICTKKCGQLVPKQYMYGGVHSGHIIEYVMEAMESGAHMWDKIPGSNPGHSAHFSGGEALA